MLRFSLLSLLPFLVSYLAIAVQIEPYTTDLKITLNDIVVEGRRTRYIVYTSVVEYDEVTTDFHNEQLAGLCKQAWDEMKSQHQLWADQCGETSPGKKAVIEGMRPGMMSAIAVGKQIYFASSMKANNPNVFLSHPDLRITQDMIQCWASNWPGYQPTPETGNNLHRSDANCGEIQAAAMYLALNKQKIQESGLKAKMVAVGTDSEKVQKPCGSIADWEAGKFGCIDWAGYANIDWVPKNTDIEQVDTIPKDYQTVDLNELWDIIEVSDIDAVHG